MNSVFQSQFMIKIFDFHYRMTNILKKKNFSSREIMNVHHVTAAPTLQVGKPTPEGL